MWVIGFRYQHEHIYTYFVYLIIAIIICYSGSAFIRILIPITVRVFVCQSYHSFINCRHVLYVYYLFFFWSTQHILYFIVFFINIRIIIFIFITIIIFAILFVLLSRNKGDFKNITISRFVWAQSFAYSLVPPSHEKLSKTSTPENGVRYVWVRISPLEAVQNHLDVRHYYRTQTAVPAADIILS